MSSDTSPYEPPKSTIEDVDTGIQDIQPASKWLRFANLIIDYIGNVILGFIVGLLVAIVFGEAGIQQLQSIPDILIGTPIMLGYYILFESVVGRTPGKLITGTRVVNDRGRKPTFGQILGRSFSRFIPFEAFSFLGQKGRGWHDSLPNTYVIKCR